MSSSQVFISYASEDSAYAKRLAWELAYHGRQVWIDHESILPGQDWDHHISKALSQCSFVVAMISATSNDKVGYIQREWQIAIDLLDRLPLGQVFLIPVVIDGVLPKHPRLRSLNCVELVGDWQYGIEKLLRIIPRHIETPDLAADLLFTRWYSTDVDPINRPKWIIEFRAEAVLAYSNTYIRGKWLMGGPYDDITVTEERWGREEPYVCDGRWKLQGTRVTFGIGEYLFDGNIEANKISGVVSFKDMQNSWSGDFCHEPGISIKALNRREQEYWRSRGYEA